jgi:hypothetical protein
MKYENSEGGNSFKVVADTAAGTNEVKMMKSSIR